MGQKIHPTGFRLAVSRNWASRWYASNRDFAGMLAEDIKVREYLKAKLKNAAVSRVLIERPAKNARITIYSARPGVVIGKKGEDIENLKKELADRLGVPVAVNIEEVRKPEIDAKLIADSITQQLEKRIMFRRAMKRAMQNAMRLGAQGIKIMSSGRLNGIEIARTEWYREGACRCTRCADIDYGFSEAKTTYGVIGVCGSTRVTPGPQRRPLETPRPKTRSAVRVARAVTAAAAPAALAVVAAPRCPRCRAPADGSDKPAALAPIPPLSASAKPPRPLQQRTVKENKHAATCSPKVPQGAKGPQHRHRHPWQLGGLRRLRPEVHRPWSSDGAPDRAHVVQSRHVKRGGASGSACSRTSPSLPSPPKCVWVTARAPSTTWPKSSPARCSTKSSACPKSWPAKRSAWLLPSCRCARPSCPHRPVRRT
jgi:small subunit ribosomal protein S3